MLRGEFIAGAAAFGAVRAGRVAAASVSRTLRLLAAPIGHGIDPYLAGASGIDELAWLYGDGLVGWKDGPVPLLADLPETRDDITFRYRLRAVSWHDGRPLRGEDVRRSWLILRDRGYHPYLAVRDVVVEGEREVVVSLDSSVHGFVRSFFGAYGSPAMPLLRYSNIGVPLGTGPFVARSFAEPDHWRLEPSATSPRGIPKLDAVDVRIIPYTPAATALALRTGEADVAYPCASTRTYAWLSGFARRRRVTSIVFFVFNAAGALASSDLRRWFVQSIDLSAVQRMFDDELPAVFTSYTMPERANASIGRLARPSGTARARLQQALAGQPLRMLYATNPVYERVMNLAQQNVGGEAFAATARFPAAALLDRRGPLVRGDFDVALIGLPYGDDPDLAVNWSCKNVAPAGNNFARWCDSQFELALQRHDGAAALQRLASELMCVPLGPAREDVRLSDRVGGVPTPEPFVPFTYSCTQWTIKDR